MKPPRSCEDRQRSRWASRRREAAVRRAVWLTRGSPGEGGNCDPRCHSAVDGGISGRGLAVLLHNRRGVWTLRLPLKCAGGRGVPNARRRFAAHQAGVARYAARAPGSSKGTAQGAYKPSSSALKRPEISGRPTYCNSRAAIFRRRSCAESDTGVVADGSPRCRWRKRQ
jgi:hypothetical protein